MDNKAIINAFYTAFKLGDAEKMVSFYDDNVVFKDPAFGTLKGEHAKNMWRMLIERGGNNLTLTFHGVQQTVEGGSAKWEAQYPFGKSKRKVHNKISAAFVIQNGKITEHIDTFDLKIWAGMALGLPGKLFGGTSWMQGKIRNTALQSLDRWESKNK